jgi:hypothetical protein
MTERERLSLTIQALAVGVVLFIGAGWFCAPATDFSWLKTEMDWVYTLEKITTLVVMFLPIILTIGLITVTIRCLKKSK